MAGAATYDSIPRQPTHRKPRPDIVSHADITILILAGGQGRRMGGQDKGLVPFEGEPLIARALRAARALSERQLISANRNRERYAAYGVPVLEDTRRGFEGPLAGIETGLAHCETPLLLCLPVDCPHPPAQWSDRLASALAEFPEAMIAAPHDGQRLQPLFSLMRREALASLEDFLDAGGRKVMAWLDQLQMVEVDFSDAAHAFTNLNTPDDLSKHEADDQ